MSAHTPGPWGVDPLERSPTIDPRKVRAKDGTRICVLFPLDMDRGAAGTDADANLIAASPELLEGAKAAVAGELSPSGEAYALRVQAIEKAEGR